MLALVNATLSAVVGIKRILCPVESVTAEQEIQYKQMKETERENSNLVESFFNNLSAETDFIRLSYRFSLKLKAHNYVYCFLLCRR